MYAQLQLLKYSHCTSPKPTRVSLHISVSLYYFYSKRNYSQLKGSFLLSDLNYFTSGNVTKFCSDHKMLYGCNIYTWILFLFPVANLLHCKSSSNQYSWGARPARRCIGRASQLSCQHLCFFDCLAAFLGGQVAFLGGLSLNRIIWSKDSLLPWLRKSPNNES